MGGGGERREMNPAQVDNAALVRYVDSIDRTIGTVGNRDLKVRREAERARIGERRSGKGMWKGPEWGGVPSEVDTTGDPPIGATRAHRRNGGRG